jgi:hypothetical protein
MVEILNLIVAMSCQALDLAPASNYVRSEILRPL